jgi:hypothetical protein
MTFFLTMEYDYIQVEIQIFWVLKFNVISMMVLNYDKYIHNIKFNHVTKTLDNCIIITNYYH